MIGYLLLGERRIGLLDHLERLVRILELHTQIDNVTYGIGLTLKKFFDLGLSHK